MNLTKFFYIITLLIFISSAINAQDENVVSFSYKDYNLTATYSDTSYTSVLEITKETKLILRSEENDRIVEIKAIDLDGNDEKEIVIGYYTGGAHCCSYITANSISNNKFISKDTLWWGDSNYEIKDLDNDGASEIFGVNSMFAYAFTNFAQSMFPVVIYRYKYGKFTETTSEFKVIVKKDINEFKKLLKEYTDKGFECPVTEDEDTFNTDAGAVKAILAAIVFDYYSLGEVETGYELVKKTYKCIDQKKFINILKKDFKLN